MPIISPRPLLLIGLLACLSVASLSATAQENEAEEKERQSVTAQDLGLQMRYYIFSPPAIHQDEREKEVQSAEGPLPADPTIIPFSGWVFANGKGQSEPWRRRDFWIHEGSDWLKPIIDQFGGQAAMARPAYDLRVFWRYPDASKIKNLRLRPTTEAFKKATQFSGVGYSNYKNQTKVWFPSVNIRIQSLEDLPDFLPVGGDCMHGNWKVVAEYRPGDALPVGNDHFKIHYIGQPRTEGPIADQAKRHKADVAEYPLEVETKVDYPKDEWNYSIVHIDRRGRERMFWELSVSRGETKSYFSKLKADEITKLQIRRLPRERLDMGEIELGPIVERWEDEIHARQVEVTPRHQFGEAMSLNVESKRAGGRCFIDIDAGKVIAMPDKMLHSHAMAKYAEKHGADLILMYHEGKLIVHPLGTPLYKLAPGHWDKTPTQCLDAVRDKATAASYRFTVGPPKDAYIGTSCDGALVMLRFAEQSVNKAARRGFAVLELRKLIDPNSEPGH